MKMKTLLYNLDKNIILNHIFPYLSLEISSNEDVANIISLMFGYFKWDHNRKIFRFYNNLTINCSNDIFYDNCVHHIGSFEFNTIIFNDIFIYKNSIEIFESDCIKEIVKNIKSRIKYIHTGNYTMDYYISIHLNKLFEIEDYHMLIIAKNQILYPVLKFIKN
jgi:hypothetical protein